VIRYEKPHRWIAYDAAALLQELTEAKAAILALSAVPYQRDWVEALQAQQLKREVAGTSRIEGAEFTDRELDAAMRETPEQLRTRSQRQASAAATTYRWLGTIERDRPIDASIILGIHRNMVHGADDDHCPPGRLRQRDENVNFGVPRHRGVEGGPECEAAFNELVRALQTEFSRYDPLVQALAAHYHLAAMHPFLDGNGRTARALEALLLARAGLRDSCFIAMSNYYYEEKAKYLDALSAVRADGSHDLTPFLKFCLRGIATQAGWALREVHHQVSKTLYKNLMFELFGRLKSPKRRVMAKRQVKLLETLLPKEEMDLDQLVEETTANYSGLRTPRKAVIRDLNELIALGAIRAEKTGTRSYKIAVRLAWPTETTESDFMTRVKELPKAKTRMLLS